MVKTIAVCFLSTKVYRLVIVISSNNRFSLKRMPPACSASPRGNTTKSLCSLELRLGVVLIPTKGYLQPQE